MTSTTFADLGVREPIVKALATGGLTTAFPIQVDTLPDSLAGRDVLGRGRTGSGKTLAFAIPVVSKLAGAPRRRAGGQPRALVLAPTRELATQIAAVVEPLATATGLTVTTIFGGVSQNRQVQALRSGADIVIACPGRLEDLMRQRLVALDAIEITVLDEADHMADLGFLPGVTRLLGATPIGSQRLLFSATLDNGVDKLVKRFLQNPVMHSVDDAQSAVPAMTHHIFDVASVEMKKELVRTLASGTGRRILFMRTKHQAKNLAKQLTAAGIPAVDLHGNLSQNARDRNLAAFTAGEARVLVATDVAARGVHVDDVELVVHVDPPAEHKAYLHRSGRTARAGSSGDVVTIVLPEQRREVADVMRKAAIKVAPMQVTPTHEHVLKLVGEVAPHVKPRPVQAAPAPKVGPSGQAARPRTPNHSGSRRPTAGSGRSGGPRASVPRSGGPRASVPRSGGSRQR